MKGGEGRRSEEIVRGGEGRRREKIVNIRSAERCSISYKRADAQE